MAISGRKKRKSKKKLDRTEYSPPNEGTFQTFMGRLAIPEWAEVKKPGNPERQRSNPFTFNVNQVGSLPMADVLKGGDPRLKVYDPELNARTAQRKISSIVLKPSGGGGGGGGGGSSRPRVKSFAEELGDVDETLGDEVDMSISRAEPTEDYGEEGVSDQELAKRKLESDARQLRADRDVNYRELANDRRQRIKRFKVYASQSRDRLDKGLEKEKNLLDKEERKAQELKETAQALARKHQLESVRSYNDRAHADKVRNRNREKRFKRVPDEASAQADEREEEGLLEAEKRRNKLVRKEVKQKLNRNEKDRQNIKEFIKERQVANSLKARRRAERIEMRKNVPKGYRQGAPQQREEGKGKEKVHDYDQPVEKEKEKIEKEDRQPSSSGHSLIKRRSGPGGDYEIESEFQRMNKESKEADFDRTYTPEEVRNFLTSTEETIKDLTEGEDSTPEEKLQHILSYLEQLRGAPHIMGRMLRLLGARSLIEPIYDKLRHPKRSLDRVKHALDLIVAKADQSIGAKRERRFWKLTIAHRKALGHVRRHKDKVEAGKYRGRKSLTKVSIRKGK